MTKSGRIFKEKEYEKIKEMDLTGAVKNFNFHMDKDTDYYIYLGGVKGCCGDLGIEIQDTIYSLWEGTEIPTQAQELSTSGSRKINVTSSDDIHWLKFTAPEEGRYKITYKDAKTMTIKSYKTVSKTITRLSKKKKYYVQIRTYKTVSKANYYSSWSGKKTVVTK